MAGAKVEIDAETADGGGGGGGAGGGGGGSFSEQRLVEKLNKLNNSAASIQSNQPASKLISDLQEQEMNLKQCIGQLESVDVARTTLINQLKEALSEQVARAEAERAIQLRQQLGGALATSGTQSNSSPLMITPLEQTSVGSGVRSIPPQSQSLNPETSHTPTVSAVDEESKRTAAAMADKLASLSKPVLNSIISSLVAEQTASINVGSPSGEISGGPPGFQIEKRPRLEKTMQTGFPGPSGPPPPPPLPPAQNQPQQQQHSPQAPQQSPTSTGFFQSSAGMGFIPPVQAKESDTGLVA
nr:unnamed protein product [Digitaria exilis]